MKCKCGATLSTIKVYKSVLAYSTLYICPDCQELTRDIDLRNKILIGDIKPDNYQKIKSPKNYR